MKKILLMLGTLLIATAAFTATAADVRAKYDALEAEYQNLEAQEEAKYQGLKSEATAASAEIAKQKALEAEIVAKIQQLQKSARNSLNGKQYAELASGYQSALGELKGEIKNNEKIVSEFQKVDAIKNPKVKEEKAPKEQKKTPQPKKAETSSKTAKKTVKK